MSGVKATGAAVRASESVSRHSSDLKNDPKIDLRRTPRRNSELPQIVADFDTLWEGLDYAAKGITGFNFYSGRGVLETVLPYCELRRRAFATGARLMNAGLARGDRVAVVAETGPEFLEVFFGCQYAGLIPCPMPYAMTIGGKEAYVERIAGMLESASAAIAITPAESEAQIAEAAAMAGTEKVLSHDALQALSDEGVELEPFGPDEVAYIQYSSGSTSKPKGVLITQTSVCANTLAIMQDGLEVTPDDRCVSWLPLYHDMGLVGTCLGPLMAQSTIDFMSTSAFARRPLLWLKLMSDNRCTISYSPSFGYDLAARRVNGSAADLDLSDWRVAGIGGDMVRPDVLELFAENLGEAGFAKKAFLPSYGMAESTLAIALADPEAPIRIDVVDRAQFKLSRRAVPASEEIRLNPARTRSFVSCGQPIAGHDVKVCDKDGCVLGEREVGHILVKGPSLMAGYFENEDATSEVMRDCGYMDTGDIGYWLEGEIVITGRAKDLILHNGRNIWPQDIEWAIEQVNPLRSGDAAAFAIDGEHDDDSVVVLVQCRVSDEEKMGQLRREASVAVHRATGVECEIVLVPPKSLPFTSSGKLSRTGAKARYLAGDISEIATQAHVSGVGEVPLQAVG